MSIRIDGTNTAANPGITGADTDTGLQFGTNEVSIVTDGTERAAVDSSGRLLVGTDTARSAGDVTAQLQVEGTSFATSSLNLISNAGASAGNVPHISLGKSRGTSDGSNTAVASGDNLGTVQFCGADGTDLNSVAASISAAVDGTPGGNDMPGRLVFSTTADGASSPTERMRIESDGTIKLASGCPGIDFSQLQTNASSMQSETLSGYEEGTFTPRLVIENGGDVTVYSNKKGCYVKVGSTVTVWFNLTVDGTPSNRSTSNAIEFHDLPFTSTNDNNNGGVAMYIGSCRINGVRTDSTYNDMSEAVIRLNPNNTMGRIELREASTSALRNSSLFLKDNTAIFATITYRTDA